MKNLVLTFVGVLLVAMSTVSLSNALNSPAASLTRMSQPGVAGHPGASAKLKQGWKLGAPVRHENLTVFPVLSDEVGSTDEFITLDAGLRSGKVKVTELKGETSRVNRRPQRTPNIAEPRTPNVQRNIAIQEQVSGGGDGAEVNKVLVTNNSGKTLVLIAGEFILGGKQDRIVGHDCIVSSTNTPVPIDVFCVEHGRWQASSFGHSRSASGSGSASVETSSGMAFGAAPEVMAAPKVRANAQANKSQSDVWSEVADKVAKNSVSTSTGTLNSVYSDKKVNTRLNQFQSALNARFADKNIVGAVVAINGKLLSADVFASPQLFQAYQAKLLKSYALEAISADKVKSEQVSKGSAEAFLSSSDGAESAVEKDGVYRLAEKQSSSDASFELVHTNKSARLIHFNRVAKK
jgi:hypothetical protein